MPNYEWATQTPKVKALTRKEFHSLQIASNSGPQTLYYLPSTGEYLKSIDAYGTNYEVMYTPYSNEEKGPKEFKLSPPLVGKREDTIIMDDVETPKSPFWGDSVVQEFNKRYQEQLSKQLESYFLYGTCEPPKGILNFDKKYSKTPAYKETEMEIGGEYCHLCGEKLLQENTDRVYKKRVHARIVKRYQCGTIVEKTFKSKGDGYICEDLHQKVILGDDCVEI